MYMIGQRPFNTQIANFSMNMKEADASMIILSDHPTCDMCTDERKLLPILFGPAGGVGETRPSCWNNRWDSRMSEYRFKSQ